MEIKTVKTRHNAYRLSRLAMEQVDKKTGRRIIGGNFLFRPNLRESVRALVGWTEGSANVFVYYNPANSAGVPREVKFNSRKGLSIGCQDFGNRDSRILLDWVKMSYFKKHLT